jgi:glycerol kinase
MASSIESNDGVFFVPAFVGLAAPYWDSSARGTIVGMTDRTTKANIVRATLESIAYQVEGVLRCMEADSRLRIRKLRVDGGPTANRFLMQFQADILGVPVEVSKMGEVTGRGTALLAGLGVGFWDDASQLADSGAKVTYMPRMSKSQRDGLLSNWKRAVARSRRWYM